MKKARLKLLLAIPAVVWTAFALCHALGGYTIQDRADGAVLWVVWLPLVLGSLVGCFFKRVRRVAVASVLILVISGVGLASLRSYRLAAGVEQLEAVYRDIAASGPPFPQSIDRAAYENPAFLHWYYQRHSEQTFAVVYIVSSDGWAMEYPDAAWRFVGFYPHGYKPDSAAPADGPSPAAGLPR